MVMGFEGIPRRRRNNMRGKRDGENGLVAAGIRASEYEMIVCSSRQCKSGGSQCVGRYGGAM